MRLDFERKFADLPGVGNQFGAEKPLRRGLDLPADFFFGPKQHVFAGEEPIRSCRVEQESLEIVPHAPKTHGGINMDRLQFEPKWQAVKEIANEQINHFPFGRGRKLDDGR